MGTGTWDSHGDRHLGVRSRVIDLFPKDENKKRKSAASVSFLSGFEINRLTFCRFKRIVYFCSGNKTICVKLKHFNYGKLKTAKS